MRSLLDVNVLIALLDSQHVHHALATRWLSKNIDSGWASCPLTQNGAIRILSQPAYPNPLPATQVAERLAEAANSEWHDFWADDISLLETDRVNWSAVLGSRQVTDCYLLALAVHHDGRFVTFDRRIAKNSVPGAKPQHLALIE